MSTILIVDDSEVCRDPIAAILQRKGYQTVCAADGCEALEAMKKASPDLVILDVAMPVMDGMTFLRTVRAEAKWRDIPVVLLTAASNKDATRGSESLGISSVLFKEQFSMSDLVDCVKRIVPPTSTSNAA